MLPVAIVLPSMVCPCAHILLPLNRVRWENEREGRNKWENGDPSGPYEAT